MIFADKLIQLRKKRGWSQEELAEQMDVTRQSVSKWEGAQAIPDVEKLLRLSALLEVSTDYLLKDEIETAECVLPSAAAASPLRRVTMEEANAFLDTKAETARPIALGVFLCILSPVCLFLLGAMCEQPNSGMTENMAGGLGVAILLLLVAAAVAIFISSGNKTASFEYLEKEIFATECGVADMVRKRREQFQDTYRRSSIIGSCLCILAPVTLFLGLAVSDEDVLLLALSLSLTLVLAGVGVMFFIRSGIIWASYEKLLQDGDYTRERKARQPILGAVSAAYWLITTAIFLGYSLASDNWDRSWIIWVVAGVLFPALTALVRAFTRKK